MKFKIVSLLFFLIFSCEKESTIVFENANIVNVDAGNIEVYNILIEGSKIAKISKEKIDASKSIDLKGKYIIPPLWDMHIHAHGNKDTLRKFFENGILGVRDMGAFDQNHIDSLVKWKQEQNLRSHKLPELVYAGFTHNDSLCYKKHRNVTSVGELKASVKYLKEIGSTFYKIHNCFPIDLLPALDSMATVYDFSFGGHIPHGIDPIEYVTKFNNVSSIEHVSVLVRGLIYRENDPLNMMEAVNVLDGKYLDSLALIMKHKSVAFTPNLISEYAFVKSYPEDKQALGKALFERLKTYTKRISDKGVIILSGSDAGLEIEAGYSLYNELKLLSEAGLSNLEVLQASTINPNIVNKASKKIFSIGFNADFLIFNDNPLEDIPTIESLYGFFHKGKLIID